MRRLALLAVVLSLASPAQAFTYDRRLTVTPENATDFTVNNRIGARLTDYWCAAGRYVLTDLGLPRKTRVYRLSPEPQKRGEGIRFTLDRARSTGKTGLTIFGGEQDGGISAGGASSSYCYDVQFRQRGFND